MTTHSSIFKNSLKHRFILLLCCVSMQLCAAAQHYVSIDTADKRINDFRQTIKAQQNVVKYIEYILVQHNIPPALRNLALIESAFNNKSLSWANAAGMWQLTPDHAAYYGLSGADRYDVLKSTEAAARTIINLYNNYNDWRIVVAAYNCGEGNINKAIKKAGSANYNSFSLYLPAETKEHVYKFLLACYATNELQLMNLPVPDYYKVPKQSTEAAIRYDEAVTSTNVNGGFSLSVIAGRLNITPERIRLLNPRFDEELTQKGTTRLILPVDKMPDFLLQKNEILTASLN